MGFPRFFIAPRPPEDGKPQECIHPPTQSDESWLAFTIGVSEKSRFNIFEFLNTFQQLVSAKGLEFGEPVPGSLFIKVPLEDDEDKEALLVVFFLAIKWTLLIDVLSRSDEEISALLTEEGLLPLLNEAAGTALKAAMINLN